MPFRPAPQSFVRLLSRKAVSKAISLRAGVVQLPIASSSLAALKRLPVALRSAKLRIAQNKLVQNKFAMAGAHGGLAALILLVGAGSVHDASAVGDTRTLTFHHTHSGEDLTVTFKRNGRYDEAGLAKINHHLRDWRSQEKTKMDPHLFDILWEVYRDVDGKQPINIISAYRSPATNAMLRRRSSGVARHSQHMLGHAIDFYIPGVSLEKIRFAGLRLQRGGVGFYPTSGSPFVHLDVGRVRHWPRMSRDQLVRVFPDGRTVHVPSDGVPLKNYQLAVADLERRGSSDSDTGARGGKTFLASLFSKTNDEDDEAAPSAAPAKASSTKVADAKTAESAPQGNVPMPRSRPAQTFQVASAATSPAPIPAARPTTSVLRTPADIINARGFWGEDVDQAAKATRDADKTEARKDAVRAAFAKVDGTKVDGKAVSDADPSATASVPPANREQGRAKLALAYAAINDTHQSQSRPRPVLASAPLPSLRWSGQEPVKASSEAISTEWAANIWSPTQWSNKGRPWVATQGAANDPWLRLLILTPSAKRMTASAFGESDMTILTRLMHKPRAMLALSFSEDWQGGISTDGFTASPAGLPQAITFGVQTAAVQ